MKKDPSIENILGDIRKNLSKDKNNSSHTLPKRRFEENGEARDGFNFLDKCFIGIAIAVIALFIYAYHNDTDRFDEWTWAIISTLGVFGLYWTGRELQKGKTLTHTYFHFAKEKNPIAFYIVIFLKAALFLFLLVNVVHTKFFL